MRSTAVIVLAACLVSQAVLPRAAAGQTADELNRKGMSLYERREYDEALKYFELAFTTDSRHHLAHYNYACTAALLLARDYCWYMQLVSPLFEHLAEAVRLNPPLRQHMATDPDLDVVRRKYRFQVVAGPDPQVPDDLRKILTGLTWYGPQPGALPASPVVSFELDGTVVIQETVVSDQGSPRDVTTHGTYRIEAGTAGLKIRVQTKTSAGRTTMIEAILRDGVIVLPGGEIPSLTDSASECGA